MNKQGILKLLKLLTDQVAEVILIWECSNIDFNILIYNFKISALFKKMTKKKGQGRGRKRTPNIDLNNSEGQEKEIERKNVKSTYLSIEVQRQRVLQFLGGNQMPREFNHRKQELNEITKYIEDCLCKKNKSKYKILMVTGSPGAGKTLSVSHVLTKLQNQKIIYKVIKFNANIIKTVRDVQQIICTEILDIKYGNQMSTLQIIRHLQEQKKKQKYVLYIEEVEIILEQKTNIFTEDFFCLFSNPKIDIMMLGISNTIDALAKYSKNISVNLNQIKNVVFKPYPVEDIVKIMKEKLQTVESKFNFKIIAEDKVLKFIAGKMESLKKGDIRIVLQFLRQLANTILPKKASQDIDANQQGYAVSMATANSVFAKMRSQKYDIINSLPHTQQIVLIAVYLHIKQEDCLFMTKKDTNKKTKWICDSLGLQFHSKIVDDGIEMLEQYCLISRSKKQNEERIMLKISLSEVQVSLQDHKLFKKFFVTEEK